MDKKQEVLIKLHDYKVMADGMLLLIGFFMTLIILCLIASIFIKHPIHSLIMLVLSFFLIAILLVFVGIEYLAALILLIYAGAISILLLFVLMMFDMKELYLLDYFNRLKSRRRAKNVLLILFLFLGFIGGYAVLAVHYRPIVVMHLYDNDWNLHLDWASIFQYTSDIKALGYVLYRFYFFVPICVGLLVLITLVCCLVLVASLNKGAKAQITSVQIHVKSDLQLK